MIFAICHSPIFERPLIPELVREQAQRNDEIEEDFPESFRELDPEEFETDRGWWYSCRICGGQTRLRTKHPYCRHCGFSQREHNNQGDKPCKT